MQQHIKLKRKSKFLWIFKHAKTPYKQCWNNGKIKINSKKEKKCWMVIWCCILGMWGWLKIGINTVTWTIKDR